MKNGEHVHPIDIAAGVEPYQRLSDGVSEALVEASRSVSYAKSAQGQVSAQSVMRKIRECPVPDTPETEDKPISLGPPDPDRALSLPARSGKVTPLFNALRPF